jgi:zinc protease
MTFLIHVHRFTRPWATTTLAMAIALISLPGAQAQEANAKPPSANAGPVIESWTTTDGARVYFVAAPELPMVDVRLVFDAASARDADKPGVAVLTNALLSEGAGELDATEIARRFEQVGARFGVDAQRDMATLSLRSLTDPDLLGPAVDTLALILKNPTFPGNSVERQRTRMLVGLKAEQEALDEIAEKALYRSVFANHPYSQPVNGTEESVKSITRDNIVDHYKRYYVAKNAVIAVVGALTREQVEDLTTRLSAQLRPGEAAPALPQVPSLDQATTINIAHPSQQTHILLGEPGITRDDPDYFALYVGNHILGGNGLVSRLSDEIREKRGLSYSTYSYFSPMRAQGPFILGLQTRNDQAATARDLLAQELKKFVEQGPTAGELQAAKENITGSFPLRIASNSKIVDYIAMIGFYQLPLDYLDTFSNKVDAVTIDSIRDAFARRVHPDKMITVIAGGAVKNGNDGGPSS